MSDEPFGSLIATSLHARAPKAKVPVSGTLLNTRIAQAEDELGHRDKINL
ncbi:MAG: hypothetical protein ABI934_13890 [Actinomycetota bacterium]